MRAVGAVAGIFAAALALAAACATQDGDARDASAARGEDDPPATDLGSAVCRGCHPVEAEHWDATLHARLFVHRPRGELEARACESCHGPGSRHLADPTDRSRIVAFTHGREPSVERMNEMCLQCHEGGARIEWRGSMHDVQGLACSDCHNPMSEQSPRGLLAFEGVSGTCFTCHPEQRTEFRKRSHMPLLEGKIACSDCHEPHGSPTDPLLRADSVNELCHQCHADKRGPFLWEHAPVVESCLSCHRPHGSNHESLLVALPPFLCQECHANPGSFSHPNDLLTAGNLVRGVDPDERVLNRSCLNCHVQIHGSNHPSGARFHR